MLRATSQIPPKKVSAKEVKLRGSSHSAAFDGERKVLARTALPRASRSFALEHLAPELVEISLQCQALKSQGITHGAEKASNTSPSVVSAVISHH